MRSSLERYPEIAQAYELYTICRNQIPFEYEYTKGGKSMKMLLTYTTGLAMLPESGSMMDQPQRLMAFFEAFLAGDEQGFYTRLQKKQ